MNSEIGIEELTFYAGQYSTDSVALGLARGRSKSYLEDEVMLYKRAVIPPFEDTVTLAVNAAKKIISSKNIENIGLLIVATESAVDFGKPVSTWVHRFCGLKNSCLNFEIKHACFGGVSALMMACAWVNSNEDPNQTALVISVDYTRPLSHHLSFDFIGGGCSSAVIVGRNPKIAEIAWKRTGFWSVEIADSYRPTALLELVDKQLSLYSYLDALEGSFTKFRTINDFLDYDSKFKYHIYHTPFPGMAYQAHRSVLGLLDLGDKGEQLVSFKKTVWDGIQFSRQLGSTYGSSGFVCLASLLEYSSSVNPDDLVSVFAYGSGCQSAFFYLKIKPEARTRLRSQKLRDYLDGRLELTREQYELNEYARACEIEKANYTPRIDLVSGSFESFYRGKELLVLQGLGANFERKYIWS